MSQMTKNIRDKESRTDSKSDNEDLIKEEISHKCINSHLNYHTTGQGDGVSRKMVSYPSFIDKTDPVDSNTECKYSENMRDASFKSGTIAHSNDIIKDEPSQFGMIFDCDDTKGKVNALQEELRSALAEALEYAKLNGTGAPCIPERFEADVEFVNETPGTFHFSSDNDTKANVQASLARSRSRIEFDSDDKIIATLPVTSNIGPKRSDIMYSCDQCDQQFPFKNSLKIHQLKHIGKTPYICDLCGKEFPNKYRFGIHNCKRSEKKHSCYICSKQFAHEINLRKHLSAHNALKKFECEFCDKKFALLDQLKNHTVVHTDEKRYSCIECQVSFRNCSSLSFHRESVHTEIRPKCDICDKKFTSGQSLHKHNTHKHSDFQGYTCEICNKFCKYRSTLNRHMGKHKGYAIKCAFCEKGFTYKYQLLRHEQVHTGARPYQCDNCKHTFSKKDSMMHHIVKRVCIKKRKKKREPLKTILKRRKLCKKKLFKCDICKNGFTTKKYLIKHINKCETKKREKLLHFGKSKK